MSRPSPSTRRSYSLPPWALRARSKAIGELEGVDERRPYCTTDGVGAVLAVFYRDVTQRKQAEAALRQYPEPRSEAYRIQWRQRAGQLRRSVEWVSPAGARVRVRSTRLVSFVQRTVAAILYEVEPVDGPLRLSSLS